MSNDNTFPIPELVAPKSWSRIILEVLEPRQGRILSIAELCSLVRQHPEYLARATGDADVQAKVVAAIYHLRGTGLLRSEGRGLVRVPGTPRR